MLRLPAIAIFLTLLILVSCEDEQSVSAALGEVPDTVSENFRQVTVSSTGRMEIEAGRVESYGKKDVTVFLEALLREFDSTGEKTLEGSAERIEITGDRDGFAEGGIRIHDYSGDSSLEAEYLNWDNRERLLTGEGKVRIESGDGLTITGDGFVADMARETYRFTEGVEGTLELNDDD